jgi:hypothetical protein
VPGLSFFFVRTRWPGGLGPEVEIVDPHFALAWALLLDPAFGQESSERQGCFLADTADVNVDLWLAVRVCVAKTGSGPKIRNLRRPVPPGEKPDLSQLGVITDFGVLSTWVKMLIHSCFGIKEERLHSVVWTDPDGEPHALGWLVLCAIERTPHEHIAWIAAHQIVNGVPTLLLYSQLVSRIERSGGAASAAWISGEAEHGSGHVPESGRESPIESPAAEKRRPKTGDRFSIDFLLRCFPHSITRL